MGKPILIIDDEQKLLKLISMLLSKKGLQIDTANDGIEGVEKLNSLAELEVTVDVNIDIYSLNKVISKN